MLTITPVRQVRFAGCGPACVQAVTMKLKGGTYIPPPVAAKRSFAQIIAGYSLYDLRMLLEEQGIAVDCVRLTRECLADVEMPAILHLAIGPLKHFVVFRGIDCNGVGVMDPAGGRYRTLPFALFDWIWTGVAIIPRAQR